MNIFKVLASGRYPFKEESASAVLAWLLNPGMDHGLGFQFLRRFLAAVAESGKTHPASEEACTSIRQLGETLAPRLRTAPAGDDSDWVDSSAHVSPWFSLEYAVPKSQIDILMGIGGWVFAIENKIYSGSAQDTVQLSDQYEGLVARREKTQADAPARIAVVFLVPSGVADPKVVAEYSGLPLDRLQRGDVKCLLSWQDAGTQSPMTTSGSISNPESAPEISPVEALDVEGIPSCIPSISRIIADLLQAEALGDGEPIPAHTRDTLKALRAFAASDFEGYTFERPSKGSGWNSSTEEALTVKELRHRAKKEKGGFVGVQHGLAGLLRLSPDTLRTRSFQFTSENMQGRRGVWLPLDFFLSVADWRLSGEPPEQEIDWGRAEGRLPWDILLEIAKVFGENVYIGIQGGETGLRNLTAEQIHGKSWQIGSEPAPQWITGSEYLAVLTEKGLE